MPILMVEITPTKQKKILKTGLALYALLVLLVMYSKVTENQRDAPDSVLELFEKDIEHQVDRHISRNSDGTIQDIHERLKNKWEKRGITGRDFDIVLEKLLEKHEL